MYFECTKLGGGELLFCLIVELECLECVECVKLYLQLVGLLFTSTPQRMRH